MELKGKIVLKDRIISGTLAFENGRITGIKEHPCSEPECFIMPGFVDLHTHGSGGFDFMDGAASDITGAAQSLARHGTTTCFPTTLTSSDDEMMALFENFKQIHREQAQNRLPLCAKMPALHLEGPYFDMEMKGSNFGLIILLMTLIIKIVVFPFAYKSLSSSAKMQALKPWTDKINEKYPKQEDAMEKQKATMELYRKAGVSPMGGCLPTLLQFPILWAMFRFFPASIELRQQSFLWAEDLSAYDSILDFGFRIPLLGDHISLFALLMAVSMFFYSKIVSGSQMSSNDPNAKMMRFMTIWMMPIMMFFICNNLSSGLSYYYLLSNLITMAETTVIKKWFVKPEEIAAKIKEAEGKPVQKSKWQQRLEEAQKMQRQMAAEQAKKNRKR